MPNPRKPTPLKMLHGTNRADRANPAEPKVGLIPETTEPPEWLGERGRTAWAEILPILRAMKVVTVADPVAFSMLCDALAEYIEARGVVQKDGATYWTQGKSVMLRKRPEVEIAADAWRRAKSMLSEFGLTPASRARVSAQGSDKADPLEKWMAG